MPSIMMDLLKTCFTQRSKNLIVFIEIALNSRSHADGECQHGSPITLGDAASARVHHRGGAGIAPISESAIL